MPIVGSIFVPHLPALVPAPGQREEHRMQKAIDACRAVARRVRAWEPEVLIVTSSHAAMYSDYFRLSSGPRAEGDLSAFGAPEVKVKTEYDVPLREAVIRWARAEGLQAGTLGGNGPALDHGTLVPLYFLQEAGVNCPIVRIGLSELSPLEHYQFGKSIAKAVEVLDRRAVFVASGNLSHKLKDGGPYGFSPQGPAFDAQVTAAMASGDFLRLLTMEHSFCVQAKECGLRSFQVMAGALDGLAVEPELLSYEGAAGVGCAVAVFTVTGQDEERRFAPRCEEADRTRMARQRAAEDPWVQLARTTLETYVRAGRRRGPDTLPEGLPAEMTQRSAGVFVSLYIHGRLRGCVGTLYPTQENVAWEIVRNAVAACSRDPRFPPVMEHELDSLEYAVSVLGKPEPIASLTELDVKRYGVIASDKRRQGVMLPGSDGVDTVELQVALALHLAGIAAQEPYTLQRFEVVRHTAKV